MLNPEFWNARRVFVTGHTGFKGSWLCLWLHHLGADVAGYALPAPTDPALFELARVAELVDHGIGDVRDLNAVPLRERLEEELKRDGCSDGIALLELDLDGFKKVCRSLGRTAGDTRLLQQIAHQREHLQPGQDRHPEEKYRLP